MTKKRKITTSSIEARALIYTILLCATLHLIINFFVAILQQKPQYANIFTILGIDLLYAPLKDNTFAALMGAIGLIVLWLTIITIMKKIIYKGEA